MLLRQSFGDNRHAYTHYAQMARRCRDFTVSAIPNIKCDTSYRYIPKPILSKLGNPRKIRFPIKGDSVVVEGQDQ